MRDITTERELDKMKGDFFHSIVHDLRGPIGTIDGFVQIMQERSTLTDKEIMYIGYIRGSCERLTQLVNDILDTAKIESGQLKLKPKQFITETLLDNMKKLYALQGDNKGIGIGFESGKEPPTPLHCDTELIERVVMNLIGNALKFTPRGGSITLAVGCLDRCRR